MSEKTSALQIMVGSRRSLSGAIMFFLVLCLAFIFPAVPGTASVITLGPGDSIQAAVDGSGDGDIIYVDSGATFRESINVTKRITLRGMNRPVIDAQGGENAVVLSANGTVLDGFKITNSISTGIHVLSNNNHIMNNIIADAGNAIFLENSQGNIISHNQADSDGLFSNGIYLNSSCNNVLVNNSATVGWIGFGIFLTESSNNTIFQNKAYGGRIVGSGIALENGSNYNEVTKNEAVCNWFGGGILLINSTQNKIDGNNVRTTGWGLRNTWTMYWGNGIALQESSRNVLRNNRVSNCYIGFYTSSSNENVFEGNNVMENLNGFGLMGARRNTISSNLVKKNSDYALGLLDLSNDNVFMNNTIENNRCGIYFQDSNFNVIYMNNSLQGNEANIDSLRSINS